MDDVVPEGDGGVKAIKGEIVGVVSCESHVCYRACNAKVVEVNAVVGMCTRSSLKVKMARCKNGMVARLMIEEDEGKMYNVTAFQNIIEEVIISE